MNAVRPDPGRVTNVNTFRVRSPSPFLYGRHRWKD